MTCPALLRRSPGDGAPAGSADGQAGDPAGRAPRAAVTLRRRLRGDTGTAQFTRYVVVGGLSSGLYALLFVTLERWGAQPANLAGVVGSTLLANELHRRLTFHAGERVSWFTAQWEAGGLAGIGLVATSLALAGVHGLVGDVGTVPQLCLVAAVTGLIGLIKFLVLRSWVFAGAQQQH
ncbi:GtrA family protein [Modestobacter sp. I12A-02662]|uniref:GtrA family protein n=1 Tax=Modestobacter sp. I12A-02662 TaxID=1730496 RepID=UPI0034DF5811